MLTNSKSKYKKEILNSVPGSSVINITKPVDEYTVKTERGDFVRCYELSGFSYQTASDDSLKSFALLKKRMLKALSSPDIAIWTHLIHEKYSDGLAYENIYLNAEFDNDFSQEVYDQYNKSLKDGVFINRFFISIVMKGIDSLDVIRKILDKKGIQNNLELNLSKFKQKAQIIETDLSGLNIKPLFALKKRNNRLVSEISELYGRLYNGEWKEVPVTLNDLNESIPSNGVFFKKESIVQMGTKNTQYGAILGVKEFDGNNNIHQFDDLLSLNFTFVMTQSFCNLSQRESEKIIKKVVKERAAIGRDDNDSIDLLVKSLIDGESIAGSFHTTFFSSASNIDIAADNLDRAESILRGSGIITNRALLDAEPCFLAQLPGNFKEITYSAFITGDNFSLFSFFYNIPLGNKKNNHWGDAVYLAKSSCNTPVYINFHEADVGHTTYLGKTGSGKTLLQNLNLLFSQKFNPSLSIFDSKLNAQPLINALNGNYYDFTFGENTGLAPFQLEPSTTNKMFLNVLVQMMAEFVEEGLTIEQINEISWAIDSFMSDEVAKEQRTVSSFIKFFPNQGEGNLHDRLIMWSKGYKLGWVFDSETEEMDLSNKVIGFNMDNLMSENKDKKNNIASLVCSYLWHRIEEKKTGEKGIIVFEEYHQLLSHPLMIEKMGKGLKMDRSKNFLYKFTSQSVSDALNSPIASAIKEQISTYFLLPNPNGVYDEYKKINITEEEFKIIKDSDISSRRGIYKQGHSSVVMNFDLSCIKKYFPILSANTELNNLFSQCKKDYGDKWLSNYLEKTKNA